MRPAYRGGVLAGVLALVIATTMLAAAVLALHASVFQDTAPGGLRRLRGAAARTSRRLHLVPPPVELPQNRPLDAIARDLRRLHRTVRTIPRGTAMARRTATLGAYDDVLLEACRVLDLPDTLSDLPPGTERDAERLRVEYLLAEAGLVPYWEDSA